MSNDDAAERLRTWIVYAAGELRTGADVRTDLLDAALAEAAAQERARPRWHHSPDMPPDEPHFCEDCDILHRKAAALTALVAATPFDGEWKDALAAARKVVEEK